MDVKREHRISNTDLEKHPGRKPGSRHVLAGLLFLGFMNVYALRVNLSVAIVAMVNSTWVAEQKVNDSDADGGSSECCPLPNRTSTHEGTFLWSESLQGAILGAFFYGYICTQFLGGVVATRYGGKLLFGYGALCTAVLTLFTPVIARTSVVLLIILRVLEGFGEGVTFPAAHALWSSWAPPLERSNLVAMSFAGLHFGTIVSLPVSGFLCESSLAGGWPSVFYVFGALGCIWFVLWMIFVFNSPEEHPRISVTEKDYIERSVGPTKRHQISDIPWRHIFTSGPVWAVVLAHTCNNWVFYMFLTELPTFMKYQLNFDLKSDSLLSTLPYMAIWGGMLITGPITDHIRRRGVARTVTVRKINTCTGFLLAAGFLVGTGYVGCNEVAAVAMLTLATGALSFGMGGGWQCNHLDLAPPYAGTLMGITNTVATIPGFLAPQFVGWLTNHKQTIGQWRIVFQISAAVSVLGALLYALLASGEQQSWASEGFRRVDAYRDEDPGSREALVNTEREQRIRDAEEEEEDGEKVEGNHLQSHVISA